MSVKLSIIVPVYNEQTTIKQIIERILATKHRKELIIVDDGSSDQTPTIIKKLTKKYSNVKLLIHKKNQGKGAALRTGVAEAKGSILIIQDADLEYSPEDYDELIQPILDDKADVVYGSRFLSGPHRVIYYWHWAGNRMITFVANVLCNLNFTDIETGYKAFRKEVTNGLVWRSNRFDFEAEFTVKIAMANWRIYEVPISYSGRTYAEGKKITWRDGLVALWTLLRYRFAN